MKSYSAGVYEFGYHEGHLDYNVPYLINSCGFFKPCKIYNTNYRTRCDHYFIYLTKGKGYYKFDNEYVQVDEGSLIYIRPDTLQDIYYPLEYDPEYYWIHFTGNKSDDFMKDLGFWDNPIERVGIHPQIIELFEKIIIELRLQQQHFEYISLSYMTEIFIQLSRIAFINTSSPTNLRSTQISDAVLAMHREYSIEHPINYYADISNLSVSQFIRNFKKVMKIPPNKYIQTIRISAAKELLQTTDLSINQIAELIGYNDSFYFSKVFKKATNVTPSEFRLKP